MLQRGRRTTHQRLLAGFACAVATSFNITGNYTGRGNAASSTLLTTVGEEVHALVTQVGLLSAESPMLREPTNAFPAATLAPDAGTPAASTLAVGEDKLLWFLRVR